MTQNKNELAKVIKGRLILAENSPSLLLPSWAFLALSRHCLVTRGVKKRTKNF